jgi:hypothetical protein
MADAGSNPLYSMMAEGENAVDNVMDDVLGPDYSYADQIKGPSSLGVGSAGTFSQMGTNANAIAYYVEALITGDPPLGNQFFVNTGGTCIPSDGQLRARYNYVNNMNTGAGSQPSAIGELGASFNGLIPGVVDDIEGLNPLYIFSAMTADASPACECYKCPVTSGSQYQFITTSLDPDFNSDICQAVDISNCPAPTPSSESFSNPVSSIPTILAGLGFLYLIFSGK